MKVKTLTIYVLLVTLVGLIGYDFYAIAVGGTESSISHLVKIWGHKYPIIPFAVGILCGHFFWGVKPTKESEAIEEMVKKLDKM